MGIDEALVEQFWPHERFPGKLAEPLLDLIEVEELWLAASQSRSARSRNELSTLIDTSVLEETMAPR
jgi:NitT/TauT family transport system substrate-binding protein